MLVIMFKRGKLTRGNRRENPGPEKWTTEPPILTTYRVTVDGDAPVDDEFGKRTYVPIHLEQLGVDRLGQVTWTDADTQPELRQTLIFQCLAHLALSNDEHRRNTERERSARTNRYPIVGRDATSETAPFPTPSLTIIDIGVVPW